MDAYRVGLWCQYPSAPSGGSKRNRGAGRASSGVVPHLHAGQGLSSAERVAGVFADVSTCVRENKLQLDEKLTKYQLKQRRNSLGKKRAACAASKQAILEMERESARAKARGIDKNQLKRELRFHVNLIRAMSHKDGKEINIAASELQEKLRNDRTALAEQKASMEVQLPLRKQALKTATAQLELHADQLAKELAMRERALFAMQMRELQVRLLATVMIQKVYRGYWVRKRVERFKLDAKGLRTATRLLCKKVTLHIALIEAMLRGRDMLETALEPELTCRRCYNASHEPVWAQNKEGVFLSVCGDCANVLGSNCLQHETLRKIIDRIEFKRRIFSKVCQDMCHVKKKCIIYEEFDTLLSGGGLGPTHLAQRLLYENNYPSIHLRS